MGTVYSFGAVNFEVLIEGAARSGGSQIAVWHIPYSDTNYFDEGGMTETRLSYTLLLADVTALGNLDALRGASNTATLPDTDVTTAILVSLQRQRTFLNGQVLASAEFIDAT